MRYQALNDIKVVDLTHFIAGPYATKLLAEFGAKVIKVEPPAGEGGRGAPLFAFLNTNKLGVTLDLKHPRGHALIRELLADADLLVENFAPGTLARLGLEPSELLETFPRLSLVSISNFGQDGAESGGMLSDLTLFARGGWTFPVGERDRAPLTPPGSLAQYVGGLYGAVGAMQAIFARDLTTHRGQHVDISLLEATVATMIYETVAFQYNGILRERAGRRFAVGPFLIVTLKCRDGYAGLQCVTDKQFQGLCDLMQRPDLKTDDRFNTALKRMVSNDALLEIVAGFFLEHDRRWLYREGQARAIPLVPVPSVAEVLEWEQTRARDYFETIDDPALGRIRIPGAPLRMHSHRPDATRPAPRLGQHNREVLGALPGVGADGLATLERSGVIAGASA
ncbi:MAG: CoA transferase [Candidatus Binataceae bacterium]